MDNSRLDRYMTMLATRLQSLPPAQREEELREVRQHLEALVAGHLMRGISEADAVDAALRQFGHADQVGRELVAVGHPKRSMLWPSVLTYICLVLVIFAIFATANDKPTDFPYGWVQQLLLALILPAGFLALKVGAYIRSTWHPSKKA